MGGIFGLPVKDEDGVLASAPCVSFAEGEEFAAGEKLKVMVEYHWAKLGGSLVVDSFSLVRRTPRTL